MSADTTKLINRTKLRLQAAGLTDIGQHSDHNEDTIFYQISEQETAALLVVADGMGGHAGGEQASQIVVTTVAEAMQDWLDKEAVAPSRQLAEEITQAWQTAVQQASEAIFKYAEENLGYGSHTGSTIAAAFVHQSTAYIVNVGDSRVYLFRQGKLHRISEDHSLVERFVQEGVITDQERYDHPARNVVTRALGPKAAVDVDLFTCDLAVDDVLLLCSDGLWEMLRGTESNYLPPPTDLAELCQTLINAANEAGGDDNISVILAQCSAA